MIRRWTQNRNETIRGSNRSIVQDCYMSGPIGRLAHLVCKAAEPIAIKVLLSCGAVVCSVLIGGCALIAAPATSPDPSPKAAQLLAEGGYVEAHLMRRFAEGHLLVRLPDGTVWLLDPKEHCSWCWIYVGKRVWVKLGKLSATLLNPKGETAECWNGGQMSKY